MVTDSTLATLHAMEAGLGIGFALALAECVRQEIGSGTLVHLLPGYHFGKIDLFAVFASSPPPAAVRRMIEFPAA